MGAVMWSLSSSGFAPPGLSCVPLSVPAARQPCAHVALPLGQLSPHLPGQQVAGSGGLACLLAPGAWTRVLSGFLLICLCFLTNFLRSSCALRTRVLWVCCISLVHLLPTVQASLCPPESQRHPWPPCCGSVLLPHWGLMKILCSILSEGWFVSQLGLDSCFLSVCGVHLLLSFMLLSGAPH